MTYSKLPALPALILIDIQEGFHQLHYFGGERNNPDAELYAGVLLHHWRDRQWPVFHVKHCSLEHGSPLKEGTPGNEFQNLVKPLPGEPVIKKSVNSAFIGTDLQQQLETQGIETVVIVGLTTQHCVSTTARMAGNYGLKTYVISNATAAFRSTGPDGESYAPDLVHALSLATLHREFATVLTAHDVLAVLTDVYPEVEKI
jgi:nicotinamidase-related amidase